MSKPPPVFHCDFNLKSHNSFGLPVRAAQFVPIRSEADLLAVLDSNEFQQAKQTLILGGGSNILFANDFEGLVLHNQIMGIEAERRGETVFVTAGGGVNWHELVQFTLEQGWRGLENLSLIPGTVGAAPVQNIGAYGVELADRFASLRAVDLQTGEIRPFDCDAGQFSYRQSFFKQPENRGRYFITSVTLALDQTRPLKTGYGAIETILQAWEIPEPTAQDVARAVVAIRRSKLPDWREVGNAGSFFKNPVVEADLFNELSQTHPNMPNYSAGKSRRKIPAAWLIEQCGWRGHNADQGGAGVYEKHALILVNRGGASAQSLVELSEAIQTSVRERFGIELEAEVNII